MIYKNKKLRSLNSFQFGLMIVGEVITLIGIITIIFERITNPSALKAPLSLNIKLGAVFTAVGMVIAALNAWQLVLSRRIESISNISVEEIDKEADGEQAKWFETTHVLVTDSFLVGFTSDIGNQRFCQRAFRYDEILRIYGYNAKHKEIGGLPGKGRYRIVVIANDKNEYTLSEIQNNGYVKANVIEEMNGIFSECKDRVPGLEYGPENMKTRKYTFPYYVLMAKEPDHRYEGEDAASRLPDDIRKDVALSFEQDNLTYRYSEKDAIVKTSMELLDDGNAQVTVSYFGDREEDIAALGDYFKELFDSGWGDGFEYDDRVVFFHKDRTAER